jgi:hypothetical protein
MTLEEIRKFLELKTQGWGAEIRQIVTGGGPVLYLAVARQGQERMVLGVRFKDGKTLADVCGDESGKLYSEDVEVTSLKDLEPLFELLPKPWLDPVVNLRGINRLNLLP